MASKRKAARPTSAKVPIHRGVVHGTSDFLSWSIPCFIAITTFLVFLPALRNDFVDWDDPANLINNPDYRGLGWSHLVWMFTTFHMTLYRPLTWITHGVDFLLWGMAPLGYHLTSLVFHVANAVLAYFLSYRLLAFAWSDIAPSNSSLRLGAGFSALLFAVHPLRVEAVAWASGRENVVAGLFSLLTLLSYLRAVADSQTKSSAYWKWMTGAWLCYALSLFSKVSGVTLPLILLILDVYPLRRLELRAATWLQPQHRLVWLEKVPFVVIAGGAALVGFLAKNRFGTVATLDDYSALSRVNQAMYGLVFYIWKMVMPVGLSPLYEKLSYFSAAGVVDIRSGLLVIALSTCFVLARKRWPAGLAAWLCYGVILIPVLGLVPFGPQVVADRYSYLACLGWAMLAGAGALCCWGRRSDGRMGPPLFVLISALAVLILVALGFLTWRQAEVWHDSETLWRHALAIDQKSSFAHNNLGLVLAERGELQQAIQHLREAVQLDPAFAEAYNNLGDFLAKHGSLEEAIEQFRKAILIKPADPGAHNNLGNALADRGEFYEAIQHFQQALRTSPANADAFYNLGRVLARLGNLEEAIVQYRHALQLKPSDPDIHNNLGLVLMKKGEIERAVDQFREALSVNPNYAKAHFNLGRVYAQQGHLDDAVLHFERALTIQPDVAEIHESLGRALALVGKKEEALQHYQEALRLMKSKNQILPSPKAEGR
jgi:tetratricopeptide (TPR) repeat protein